MAAAAAALAREEELAIICESVGGLAGGSATLPCCAGLTLD